MRLLRWSLNVKQFQSDVARHGLEGLKELGMRIGLILISVEIGFEKTVMQRS